MSKSFGEYRGALSSVAETRSFALNLAKMLQPGMIVGFSGSLGVGKTECIRALGEALGVKELITSPTYTLESIYEIPENQRSNASIEVVHHWDLYRIKTGVLEEDIHDASELTNAITLIEWPEQVPDVLDLLHLHILIDFITLDESDLQASDSESRSLRVRACVELPTIESLWKWQELS